MTDHRDLELTILAERVATLENGSTFGEVLHDLEMHIDRLYERHYDLWEFVNDIMESFHSPPTMPLKFK